MFFSWPQRWWSNYFFVTSLIIPSIVGCITTVWFSWGGIRDLRQLFISLRQRKDEYDKNDDNGQILDSEDHK